MQNLFPLLRQFRANLNGFEEGCARLRLRRKYAWAEMTGSVCSHWKSSVNKVNSFTLKLLLHLEKKCNHGHLYNGFCVGKDYMFMFAATHSSILRLLPDQHPSALLSTPPSHRAPTVSAIAYFSSALTFLSLSFFLKKIAAFKFDPGLNPSCRYTWCKWTHSVPRHQRRA